MLIGVLAQERLQLVIECLSVGDVCWDVDLCCCSGRTFVGHSGQRPVGLLMLHVVVVIVSACRAAASLRGDAVLGSSVVRVVLAAGSSWGVAGLFRGGLGATRSSLRMWIDG